MASPPAATGKSGGSGAGGPLPLVPILLLRRGRVCRPGDDGPQPAAGPDGSPIDPFDVIDRLARDSKLLYLVDLDGIERGEPQLDYIQEFSRDLPLWVDGGVRTADQSIDILVAGAQRAVVSTGLLAGPTSSSAHGGSARNWWSRCRSREAARSSNASGRRPRR